MEPEQHEFLNGEVTFAVASPWGYSWAGWDHLPSALGITGPVTMTTLLLDSNYDERVVVLADPLPVETGCEGGRALLHAEALAETLRADPDLDATEPDAMSVGGMEGWRMEVGGCPGSECLRRRGVASGVRCDHRER